MKLTKDVRGGGDRYGAGGVVGESAGELDSWLSRQACEDVLYSRVSHSAMKQARGARWRWSRATEAILVI
jgi:hypothetical protein